MSESIPAISVAMPVYNTQRYLRESVESILNQTFRGFEFLIIDDGSTDDSLRILKEYATRDQRIRLISRPNTGLVVALNEMLELATGEYIARIDSDDVASPTRLAQQLEFLQRNRDCVCVGGQVEIISPSGEAIGMRGDVFGSAEIDSQLLEANAFAITHAACLFRLSAVRSVGGYDESLPIAEDIDLFLKLAEVGLLANLPSVVLKYRMHTASATHRKMLESQRLTWQVINRARQRRQLPEVDPPVLNSDKSPSEERWAWWALMAGNANTARKLAASNLCRHPVSINAWKLFACALRGY